MPDEVVVRPVVQTDSLKHITELLHRAYAPLGAAGLNYSAVDQSVQVTAERIATGTCAVAVHGDVIVGTIIVAGIKANASCAWYREPFVATAHQFAVEPTAQGAGIGSALMAWAEAWALAGRFRELAVDTAEPARHVIAFYTRRGYRFIEFAQWPGKHYRTVILSKALPNAP